MQALRSISHLALCATFAALGAACDATGPIGPAGDGVDAGSVAVVPYRLDLIDAAVPVDAPTGPGLDVASALALTEGTSGALQVRLTAAPAATKVVSIASSDTGAVTATPSALTFTAANWNVYQTVTVTAVVDVDTANESVVLTMTGAGLTTHQTTVAVTDRDHLGVIVTPAALTVTEGAAPAPVSVRLSAQPVSSVTLTITSSDPGAASANVGGLSFTTSNWSTPQTLMVSGVNDVDTVNEAVTLTLVGAGVSAAIPVSVVDDDAASQAIQVDSMALTVGEAGQAALGVHLAFAPATPITVSLTSLNTGVATVSPATLTFTAANFATVQTVRVAGVNDSNLTNEQVLVRLSAAGLTPVSIAVTVLDDDLAPPPSILIPVHNLTVREGSSAPLAVTLSSPPTGNYNVIVGENSVPLTVTPSALTFTATNWNVPQVVTITAAADADALHAPGQVITLTGPGSAASLVVAVEDDDLIVASPGNYGQLCQGTDTTISVQLAGRPLFDSQVIAVTKGVGAGDVTLTPTALTFTAQNWMVPQAVTVTGVKTGSRPFSFDSPNQTSVRTPGTVMAWNSVYCL